MTAKQYIITGLISLIISALVCTFTRIKNSGNMFDGLDLGNWDDRDIERSDNND